VAALLADPGATVALLFPSKDAVSPAQLQRLAADRGSSRVVVIAIDANWQNAGRVAASYPEGVLRVALPPELVLGGPAAGGDCPPDAAAPDEGGPEAETASPSEQRQEGGAGAEEEEAPPPPGARHRAWVNQRRADEAHAGGWQAPALAGATAWRAGLHQRVCQGLLVQGGP
jgi:hypothetical protein